MTRPTGTHRTTSAERARLAAELRELKARTGMSLARLEERTPYSKSSWERYLNGKTLPPRQAVLDLCRLAHEPAARCLALWGLAESEASGRARAEESPTAPAQQSSPPPASSPSPATDGDTAGATDAAPAKDAAHATDTAKTTGTAAPAPADETGHAVRKGAVAALVAAVCALATGAVALALFLLPHPGGGPRAFPSPPQPVLAPLCGGATCEGGDPMALHCGPHPATLASHHTAAGVGMELRYSKDCGASWARVWAAHVGDRIEVTADGRSHSARVKDADAAKDYVYTPMTATRPGTAVRACFRPTTGGRPECVEGRVTAPPPTPATVH
ncbi:XRE family transcriptional regulator [Streptomyces sp. Ru72]|uniref:helix-turn-helix domain-containing protein n=1 Tax=Streptomyces sp. Ru72 TaxID=2080747 RepID=UPI000CDDC46F|nr:XRE family transcriptional regulator [Streptomyces sp. Ru72]POX53388.1 XRE family transcriptional regulator [Streptomyces sp. Ru72]